MTEKQHTGTDDVLSEIRNRRSEAIIEVDEQTSQMVIASLAEDWIAIPGSFVKEILTNSGITFVPGLPGHFLGVLNVRGDLESVVDLSRVLGLSRKPNAKLERVLLAEAMGISSGLLVDYVHDIVDIPIRQITDSLHHMEKARANYFVGEFAYKDRTVAVVNVGRVFEELAARKGD